MATCPKCGEPVVVSTESYTESENVACSKGCGWYRARWRYEGLSAKEKDWWAEYDRRQAALLAQMAEYP